ncbi:hypothetical protein HAX54_001262, partial [Datura stramonium]|nr:hypothetical protein [Datura stramonium]
MATRVLAVVVAHNNRRLQHSLQLAPLLFGPARIGKGGASGSQSQSHNTSNRYPACPKCGENHPVAPASQPAQQANTSSTDGGQHQKCFYALSSFHEQESSPDVVT